MTPLCTELDQFFDGELETDQAAAFREHLVTCDRCQLVLHGRMQEAVVAYDDDPVLAQGSRRSVPATAGAELDAPAAEAAAAAATAPNADRAASARAPLDADATSIAANHAPEPIPDARRAARRRRVLIYAAPVVAAAAVLPLFWFSGRDTDPLVLNCPIKHGSTRARSVAHVGDVLNPTASGERHRAILVYFERDLRAACPGDGQCSEADGKLELQVSLKEPGLYTVVALGSADEIPPPAPGKTLDEVLAQCTGIHCERRTIQVDD